MKHFKGRAAALLSVLGFISLVSCSGGTSYVGTSGGTSYTVTFETNGGSAVDPQTVAAGETAKKPEDPKKDGCDFGGWYADSGLASEFSFTTKITKNITLYARWIDGGSATYEVTVETSTNGGVTADKTTGVAEGSTVTLTAKPSGTARLKSLKIDGTEQVASVTAGTREFTFAMPAKNVTVTAEFGWIGTKEPSEAKAVGDIVFNDGSATPYADGLTLTDDQKSAAVAVIFYVGTGLNSGDNTATSRTLGVGLAQNQSGLAWCLNSASAYSWDIDTIQCPASGSAGSLTFTGDRNGSDNLLKISDFLRNKSITDNTVTDDTATAASYPAFYFAENYKSQTGSRVSGTDYESGWYLPSIAELFQIWTKRTDLNNAIALCAGTGFDLSKYYWSSSQYASDDDYASGLGFSYGDWYGYSKYSTSRYVCAVRAF